VSQIWSETDFVNLFRYIFRFVSGRNTVLDENNAHVGVYQVLDELMVSTSVPPGAKGAMFSIIDQLRTTAAPVEDLRGAERISIEMHRLEQALRRGDEPAVQVARDELKSLAAAWVQRRIFAAN